jgi:hypothetical protein
MDDDFSVDMPGEKAKGENRIGFVGKSENTKRMNRGSCLGFFVAWFSFTVSCGRLVDFLLACLIGLSVCSVGMLSCFLSLFSFLNRTIPQQKKQSNKRNGKRSSIKNHETQ